MKSSIKLFILSFFSLSFLVACNDDTEKIAKTEAKFRLAEQEHYKCVRDSEDSSGKGCEKLKQERDKLRDEYKQLVKKL